MAEALELEENSAIRGRVAEPPCEVTEEHFGFEVRTCRPTIQARTVVRGGYRENLGDGFRVLAGYLYGGNRTPRGTSVDIEFSGPIVHVDRGAVSIIAVTLPAGWSFDELPRPVDPRVTLAPTPPARHAVLKFEGRATAEVVAARKQELLQLVVSAGLDPVGEMVVVQHELPWVLTTNRRNEIRVPIA